MNFNFRVGPVMLRFAQGDITSGYLLPDFLLFREYYNTPLYLSRREHLYTIGRASTRPQTASAPAAKSGAAQASNVAPVVDTSSTTTILRP